MDFTGVVPGIVAALTLQGLFLLLKQQRDSVADAVRYVDINHILSYRSISEFLSQKRRSYLNFVLFRTLPVIVVMLPTVGYVQEHYLDNGGARWWALLSFIVINSVFVFVAAKRILPHTSLRLTHALLALLTFLSALLVVLLSYVPFIDLTAFSLRWDDLKNNLAAALIAAALVALFFSTARPRRDGLQRIVEEREKQEFLEQQRELIEYRYQGEISQVCSRFGLDRSLVQAVLIYENLNRPKPLRRLENLLVRLPGVTLTVGVAQVQSHTALTDGESIIKMGQILWESLNQTYAALPNNLDRIETVLTAYNGSPRYGAEVLDIFCMLRPAAG